jgi:2-keto-4-pentenoate hydratase/2-oxohepta-3-ene-1,7-dioic acid hydratase in catechol pathway
MKLLRYGQRGSERPAVWASDDEAYDVSAVTTDFGPSFFADSGIERLRDALGSCPRVDLAGQRLGAPIARPHKLVAIGLNYSDHVREAGAVVPERPIVFDKATSSIVGPYDDVVLPDDYATVDYEVELALVMGRAARRVDRASALSCVAGYLICNDISERTAQLKEGGQWYRGKSFDTFAPLGPFLVTPDSLGDPHGLELVCKVDGELRQRGNTKDLLFDIPTLIEFLSRNITLEPGDVIATGTPPGVAMGMQPPRYLTAGQVMELEVTGLGVQRSRVVQR